MTMLTSCELLLAYVRSPNRGSVGCIPKIHSNPSCGIFTLNWLLFYKSRKWPVMLKGQIFQCTEKPLHLNLATVKVPLPHVCSSVDQPRDQPSLNHDLTIFLPAQSNKHATLLPPCQTLMNERTYLPPNAQEWNGDAEKMIEVEQVWHSFPH